MQCFAISDGYRVNGLTGGAVDSRGFERLRQVALRSARNEYVSFQIVLEAGQSALESVRFAFAGDAAFEKLGFTTYYEWYHACGGKLIPDLLAPWLPELAHAVSEQAAQYYETRYHVFWVDCFVPVDMREGLCSGHVKVSCQEGGTALDIDMDISRVALCDESLVTADLNNYGDNLSGLYPSLRERPGRFKDGSYFAMERNFFRTAHEHRGLFHLLGYTHSGFPYEAFAPQTEGRGTHIRVSDWSLFDEHFGPYFDGSAFAGTHRGPIPVPYAYLPFGFDWPASYEKWDDPGFRIENRRVLLDFIRHFEEKGWTRTALELFYNHKKRYRFYPYDGDEVKHAPDEALMYKMRDMFSDLLDLSDVQVILRTDSSWSFGKHYNSEFSKIIKLWVAGCGLFIFHPESAKHMKKQGNTLWIYSGLTPLDADLTTLFEWPMRCLQSGVDGFTMWNTTGIGGDFLTSPVADGTQALFYPAYPFGMEDGVFPSLRLKYLRNAMQMADLVKMYEGTYTYEEMLKEINRLYGITQDRWFAPNPQDLDIAPEDMSNEIIGLAHGQVKSPSEFATPDLPARVKAGVLALAEAFVPGSSIWG